MNGVVFENINSNIFSTTNTNKTLLYSSSSSDLNVTNNGANTQIFTALTMPLKYNVRVASTANISLSSTLNSTSIDGVTVTVGDRVLLKDQTSGVQNGIYVVNTGLATRASDMIVGKSISNFMIPVNQGTQNTGTTWVCSNTIGSDVVGTNSLTFVLSSLGNDVEILTTAGTVSVSKRTTMINDATTQTFQNMPEYTLAAGPNGQIKKIVSNTGVVRVNAQNLNNQGGQMNIYTGLSCELVSYNSAWYSTLGTTVYYPYEQQGSALAGSGDIGASQGYSVAMSYDGNTVAVGGWTDNTNIGAVWIFVRSNGTWTQQGSKLVPSDVSGTPNFGESVALSADGNTLVGGGSNDNSGVGATWVFTRSGGVWSQVGLKLVGGGAVGNAGQGQNVSVSGDGLTLATGGPLDNTLNGAVWIFVFSGGSWTQQGSKLTATSPTGAPAFAVPALSYDGNTIVIGGYTDNSRGAIWAFTRTGITWTVKGVKMTPSLTLDVGSQFGRRISMSADGSLIAVSAQGYTSGIGTSFVFRRIIGDAANLLTAATYYVQIAGNFLGLNQVGAGSYGLGLALSKNGTTIAIGAPGDNSSQGAVWIYTSSDNGLTWNFVGSKITNSGNQFGSAVALSSNGGTMIVGARNQSASFIYV